MRIKLERGCLAGCSLYPDSIKGKRKFYVLEAMMEVDENSNKDFRKIRVILIEDKRRSKVFYSVMDKKQKEKRQRKSGTPHA